jgi:hypothetical protein
MSETISRRKLFGFLGLAVLALAAPALVSEEAEAQTVGMERRHGRRMGRRMGRRVRRMGRRGARATRRAVRRGPM